MHDILPRLKPDPIPTINPVPEYLAAGDLADVYQRTRAGLNVPWMGVVAMAFAHYPRFYESLWSALAPVVASEAFASACRSLRDTAEAEARRLAPSGIASRLLDKGYSPQELVDIRTCNEVFSDGNMPYLLMATVARLLLEGHEWAGSGTLDPYRFPAKTPRAPGSDRTASRRPKHSAGLCGYSCHLGALPFVNTDYRAFARWPSYFSMAWADLKGAVQGPDYADTLQTVHTHAVDLASSLPNPSNASPDILRSAADKDANVPEVLAVVQLFQWLLPGLATNVAFLRHQLVE